MFFEEASKEKEWWGNNYHSFLKCLKQYNPDNNLILVTDIQNKFQDMSIPFYVENDEGKTFCEHPLDNNHKLRNYYINSYNDKMRKKNLERSQMQKNNIVGFGDRLKKKIIRCLTEKIPYQHDKQY